MESQIRPLPLATPAGEPPLLGQMAVHLKACRELCDSLERIADNLPDNVDAQEALHVARGIYATVKRSHEFEEKALFPLLLDDGPREETCKTIQRLHAEHWEDESFAFEVQDALTDFVRNPGEGNAEALGYMLRGFFEGMRRHLAFECEHVVPAIRHKLTSGIPSHA